MIREPGGSQSALCSQRWPDQPAGQCSQTKDAPDCEHWPPFRHGFWAQTAARHTSSKSVRQRWRLHAQDWRMCATSIALASMSIPSRSPPARQHMLSCARVAVRDSRALTNNVALQRGEICHRVHASSSSCHAKAQCIVPPFIRFSTGTTVSKLCKDSASTRSSLNCCCRSYFEHSVDGGHELSLLALKDRWPVKRKSEPAKARLHTSRRSRVRKRC